jgi:hypothetical protein
MKGRRSGFFFEVNYKIELQKPQRAQRSTQSAQPPPIHQLFHGELCAFFLSFVVNLIFELASS